MIGVVTALACGAGCASNGSDLIGKSPRNVHRQVFEVGGADVDRLIPAERRSPVAKSPYGVAVVPADVLDRLARMTRGDSGRLDDRRPLVAGWPGVADAWSYSRSSDKLMGGGGGAGRIGVRGGGDSTEVRIEYDINHTVNTADLGRAPDTAAKIDTRISHQGRVPTRHALVCVAPFERADGQAVAHIVAFTVLD